MTTGLTAHGVPAQAAAVVAHLPPTSSLFAALLGYNPLQSLLGPSGLNVLSKLPQNQVAVLTGKHFFPTLISSPFHAGLALAFIISAVLMLVGAVASIFRGTYQAEITEAAPRPAERVAK